MIVINNYKTISKNQMQLFCWSSRWVKLFYRAPLRYLWKLEKTFWQAVENWTVFLQELLHIFPIYLSFYLENQTKRKTTLYNTRKWSTSRLYSHTAKLLIIAKIDSTLLFWIKTINLPPKCCFTVYVWYNMLEILFVLRNDSLFRVFTQLY